MKQIVALGENDYWLDDEGKPLAAIELIINTAEFAYTVKAGGLDDGRVELKRETAIETARVVVTLKALQDLMLKFIEIEKRLRERHGAMTSLLATAPAESAQGVSDEPK
jgi:hypothetical protein